MWLASSMLASEHKWRRRKQAMLMSIIFGTDVDDFHDILLPSQVPCISLSLTDTHIFLPPSSRSRPYKPPLLHPPLHPYACTHHPSIIPVMILSALLALLTLSDVWGATASEKRQRLSTIQLFPPRLLLFDLTSTPSYSRLSI